MERADVERLERLRADTPGCATVVHLNNAGSALPPRQVTERQVEHLRLEAEGGGYEAADRVSEELDAVRPALARLINASPTEIALTDSATRSWLAAFTGLSLRRGDRILTAAAEYSSNIIALFDAARRYGVQIDVVPSEDSGEVSVPALQEMLDEDVKVVAITHAPTNGGLLQPVERIGAALRGSNALFLLDACQSVGQIPIDVQRARVDVLSATGRKYLRAPRGTGFLYVRDELVEQTRPVHLDLYSATLTDDGYRLRSDAQRFELWERNVAAVLGLGTATRYYLDEVGTSWGFERITRLAATLREELSTIPGVTVTDLGRQQSGIVTFRHRSAPAYELAEKLRAERFNVTVSRRQSTPWDMEARQLDSLVRASVHYYNTDDELSAFCRVVASLTGGR